MDERVPRSTSLDFPQADQVPSFEIAVAVFELPEWRVGGARVEDIADYGGRQYCSVEKKDAPPRYSPL